MSVERKPLIGITCCTEQIGLHPFNIVGEKYILGVVDGANGLPLLIPALGSALDTEQLLELLDGIMFTGSPKAAIARGVPVLGICRGFQEMNVAFGGSLHQRLHEVGGYIEHREPKDQPVDIQYGLSHEVQVEPGGLLYDIAGCSSAQVNSLHTQGVDKLAPELQPEARASDGLIEAFSVRQAPNFALGVQWHPEWQVKNNSFYLSIFQAFGDACRARASRHS